MSNTATPEYLLYPVDSLIPAATRLLSAAGMREDEAVVVAELLIRTELRGVETHGLRWLPNYCRALRERRTNPRPEIRIAADLGSALLVDGDRGPGHLVSARAMSWTIERARECGLACAAVRNSRHNGAASLYALQASEAGLIGLSLTGGGVRVAPAGGREALLGTNPIAFAAPTGEEPPFVMDAATSVVAGAKVELHASRGLPIPVGWALDLDGNPTPDAAAGSKGPLLPLGGVLEMGGHKGFALGLLVETLCNALTAMATGPERARGLAAPEATGSGHFLLALRVDGLRPEAEFRAQMDRTLRLLRESAPAAGVERVYTPGEIEWRKERERREKGVPLLRSTVAAIDTTAAELGVEGLGKG